MPAVPKDADRVFQLVYVSSAQTLFSADQLRELLARSREKNHRLGISGLLLYREGNLMQMLEGDETAVLALYEVIQRDSRHIGVLTLLRQRAQPRMFTDWSMAFRDLNDPTLTTLPGFSDVLSQKPAAREWLDQGKCLQLMRTFRERM